MSNEGIQDARSSIYSGIIYSSIVYSSIVYSRVSSILGLSVVSSSGIAQQSQVSSIPVSSFIVSSIIYVQSQVSSMSSQVLSSSKSIIKSIPVSFHSMLSYRVTTTASSILVTSIQVASSLQHDRVKYRLFLYREVLRILVPSSLVSSCLRCIVLSALINEQRVGLTRGKRLGQTRLDRRLDR